MKKRIISLLLVLVLVAALVPQLAANASAARQLTAAPYAPVEYNYSATASAGTIRYVSQLSWAPTFYKAYWTPYEDYAGHECLTACVSMALSYVGVSATPAELGDYWNMKGYTGGVPFRTIQWDTQGFGGTYIKTSLDHAMASYLNGNGTYSPAVIHLNTYSVNGHWVMVAGKVDAHTYLIVDPANDAPWTMRVWDGNVYYERNGEERSEPLTEVFQYYNANAKVGQTGGQLGSGKPVDANATAAFVDMPSANDWSYQGINYCVSKGLMNGVDATHFDPYSKMTRAMLVTVLYRAAGAPAVSTANLPFTDLRADWYRSAVAWAYRSGISSGVSQTCFDPDGKVTREQIVAMLYRFSALQGGQVNNVNGMVLNGYGDGTNVSDWAHLSFCWAVENGIINGVSGELQPQGQADRAQIATILMRFMQM